MITKKEVAIKYLDFLEKGNKKDLLKLFAKNGIVDSPAFAVMNATDFYNEMMNISTDFKQNLKGIFDEKESDKIVLYFCHNKDQFDVVEILEFNQFNKIQKLKIIYDTRSNSKIANNKK